MRAWRVAVPAALAAAIFLAACAVPDDENWFRITGFQDSEEETSLSVFHSNLRDEGTDRIDVLVENTTIPLGTAAGGGIHVFRATVRYVLRDFSLPVYDYPVTLSIPATGDGGGSTTATLEDLPLAPAALKTWLLDPAHIPTGTSSRTFQVEARITLRARNGEGTELETSGSLGIVFQ